MLQVLLVCLVAMLSMALLTVALLATHPNLLWQVMLVCLVLVAPLLWLLLLAVLWAAPLRATTQRSVLVAVERCFAWAALDVFALTILAGLSQLSQYAQFMLGGECDGLDAMLAAHFATLLPGAPTCFGVATRLRAGCSVLLYP